MLEKLQKLLDENPFKPLSEAIYEILLEEIIEFNVLPESKLTVVSIANELGVSRTPVKEALLHLTEDGLVDFIPNRGFFVSPFNTEDYVNYFRLRTEIEAMAARAACGHITPMERRQLKASLEELNNAIRAVHRDGVRDGEWKFHHMIVTLSHNPYLISAHESLYPSFRRYNIYTVFDFPRHKTYTDYHTMIYQCLKLGNADTCEAMIRAHLGDYPRTYERDYINVLQMFKEKAQQESDNEHG